MTPKQARTIQDPVHGEVHIEPLSTEGHHNVVIGGIDVLHGPDGEILQVLGEPDTIHARARYASVIPEILERHGYTKGEAGGESQSV